MNQWQKPVLGVSVIVFRDKSATEVLLIERGREPAKGLWAPPGGKVEVGETVAEAARREVLEETNLQIHLPDNAACTVLDRIHRAVDGTVIQHYVLIEVVAWCEDNTEAIAGDDAAACRWWAVAELHKAQPQVKDLVEVVELAKKRLAEEG